MNDFLADAAAQTLARAEETPVQAIYDGRTFVPVRADHLYHLIKTVEQHGQLLAALCEAQGITPQEPPRRR